MRILNISRRQLKEKFKERVKDLTDDEADRAVEIVLEFLRTDNASKSVGKGSEDAAVRS